MLASAIRGADLRVCQLSPRPEPSWLARLALPRVVLDFASFGPAMAFSGAMPRDCFTFVYIVACPSDAHSFTFATDYTDGYLGFFPPSALFDGTAPVGYANANLTVPTETFYAALARYYPEIPDTVLKHGAAMRVGPVEQIRLRALLDHLKQSIHIEATSFDSEVVRRTVERELTGAFVAALHSGCDSLVPPPAHRMAKRQHQFRKARDYLTEHLREPVYLDDLSRALGLCHRAVESLFHDFYGVSPLKLLRHQRLHGAHRALQQAKPETGLVKRIALEWGFLHLGHFAGDYRRFFGENPSETLAEMPRKR